MENLSLRQEAVKSVLARYKEALEANQVNREVTDFLLKNFREGQEEWGLPLHGEEVLTSINLLESLVDLTEETTLEDIQQAIFMLLLTFAQELKERWEAKDKQFFIE